MTQRNNLPRSARRGYAMVVVLVFLAVMLSMFAVSQRRLGSVLRIESHFIEAEARGEREQAMGKALDTFWWGPPPSDPYICSTVIATSAGPKSFTITFKHQGGDHWKIVVVPTAPSENPPPLPAKF